MQVRDTYNEAFKLLQSGELAGCDLQLLGILICNASDPDLMQAMRITYDFYKEFKNRQMNLSFWDDLVRESGELSELSCRNEAVEQLLLHLISVFEADAKERRLQ